MAKEVFEKVFKEDIDPEAYVKEKGLLTVNDEGALRETVAKVIAENPQSVEDYHHGKDDESDEGKSKSCTGEPDLKGIAVSGQCLL